VAGVLALAGFMGSGKSSVGARLASELGWVFVDLDTEFEKSCGSSIAAFFKEKGERAFRVAETEVLLKTLIDRGHDLVLSLGGGTLERPENVEALRGRGVIVLLDVDPAEAWRRTAGSERPLAADRRSFLELWRARRSGYADAATWVLPAQPKTAEEIAAELCDLVRSSGRLWDSLWVRKLGATDRGSTIVGGVGALSLLQERSNRARADGALIHVVSDKNVMEAWGERVLSLVGGVPKEQVYVLEPGEMSKSVDVLEGCWDWLADRRARRGDIVLALGGGVVGDLAGFAAATYKRGVSLWQVPTTVIAQVDSSVGGKTAVNLEAGKNLVGSFYQADFVVVDPSTLSTLPASEYTGGLGEVVKYALLDSECSLAILEAGSQGIIGREEERMGELVRRSVFVKAAVVEKDEREEGCRAVLNLGHTTAHALETSLGFGTLNHGAAVGLGLLVALAVSERVLGLDPRVRERTSALLRALGVKTTVGLPPTKEVLEAAAHDKKASRESRGFVGLRSIGEPVWGLDVDDEVFTEALGVIRA
jgi:shikimate kinase/3-dehydroquinate synthase